MQFFTLNLIRRFDESANRKSRNPQALLDPHNGRIDPGVIVALYPLTRVATALTMVFELTAPAYLLWLYYAATPDRPGRLRRFANRYRLRWIWLALGVSFEIGIALGLKLGAFPFGMLALFPLLLLPEDPRECFEFGALSFDLADRLQTPVFVMLDLDIGMQDWLVSPLAWDDARRMDRGKVMTAADLDAGRDFGRYLDVDGDGIPYRTYPGTHAARGSYFTRGTTKDRYARYTEEGPAYVDNMQRLLRKFETAKGLVPKPVIERAAEPTTAGVIWFGSTGAAMAESLVELARDDIHLDRLRIRAFPFDDSIPEFVAAHDHVFVVEQNRDAQLKMLLVNECGIDPAKLTSVLHYDGTPITARFITREIGEKARLYNVTPLRSRKTGGRAA